VAEREREGGRGGEREGERERERERENYLHLGSRSLNRMPSGG
jgi:hypothetical protein